MFIEKVKSEGLAHLSWVVGGDGRAAVIDPRRDCGIYLDIAARHDCRITHIFETHRNEDLLSGAAALARRTDAQVLHGPNPEGAVVYAATAREGDEFEIGSVLIRVLETPGHTDDSLSFAVHDPSSGNDAVGVFTGDALFVGDVGRTDFYPDRAREVAGLLFDSLRKICSLGDQAVIYPAHGAGSVCGDAMADREVSTIGHERRNNPRLQIDDREAFIEEKIAEHHRQPPYFRRMERGNLEGATELGESVVVPPLNVDEVIEQGRDSLVLDVRGEAAFLGAHVPGSLAIPVSMIPSFAGWFLDAEQDLLLVADDAGQAARAMTNLGRIGYDRVEGYLASTMPGWAATGNRFGSLPVVDATEVKHRLEAGASDWQLLDVRDDDEFAAGRVAGARQVFLGELPDRLETLDTTKRYTVMCGSGSRATIAASILARSGFESVDVWLGSFSAWTALDYPVEQ